MALNNEQQIAVHRMVLAALGAAAALGLWLLSDHWDDTALAAPVFLALFIFVPVYFGVALALAGPVSVGRALAGALALAVPVTALVSLAGLRQVQATDLLDDPAMLGVAALLVLFSTPFLLVWLQDRPSVLRYASLFDAAWTMTVRYVAAWAFVAVFWLVVFLSDSLLKLVDIDAIGQVLGTDWARFGLSGAVLGLGLAVVDELRDTISPFVFLRLFRLLVPVVLAVVAVFLVAVPVRGLSDLFGDFSAAGPLMGAAIAAVTLISVALDRSDETAVRTRGLRGATRGLALLLPLLAALAVWALVLRVRDYGWTPDRILASLFAMFLLAYGLGYGAACLGRTGWMARVRRVNVAMALAAIAVLALWMTPVLDVYRLSSASQLARFQAGQSKLVQLPLWQMGHDWGRAGKAALARLETMTDRADHAELLARIQDVRNEVNPFQFEQAVQARSAPDRARALLEVMAVRPQGSRMSPGLLAAAPAYRLDQWLTGCRRRLPDGRAGCVLVQGAFSPSAPAGAQGIVLYLDGDGTARADHVVLHMPGETAVRDVFDPVANSWPILPGEAVAQALDGEFQIRPSGSNALFIGGAVLGAAP